MHALKVFAILFLLATGANPVVAQSSVVASALPGAEVRGTATLRFLGLPLYQARLGLEME